MGSNTSSAILDSSMGSDIGSGEDEGPFRALGGIVDWVEKV